MKELRVAVTKKLDLRNPPKRMPIFVEPGSVKMVGYASNLRLEGATLCAEIYLDPPYDLKYEKDLVVICVGIAMRDGDPERVELMDLTCIPRQRER